MARPHSSTFSPQWTIKIITIMFVTLVLFVPLLMVWALISERANRRQDVEREVSSVWGQRQTLGGVALIVPFETVSRLNGVDTRAESHLVVLPRTLNIAADLAPEVRRRSIFSVNLYRTTLVVSGTIALPDLKARGIAAELVLWNRAIVATGVSDLRGMLSVTSVAWGDHRIALAPGDDIMFGSSLTGPAPLTATDGTIPFRFELTVAGSSALMFAPTGDVTTVTLRSPWPSPGFDGARLPTSHNVSPTGFDAVWQSNYLSRAYPQSWVERGAQRDDLERKLQASTFGVNLVTTVDGYQQTERAVKYGFLFIVMTLSVFLGWETVARARLHPVQYLLVGLALVVFYLLLLSLTEQIAFGAAYAVASAATVLLLGAYASHALGRRAGAAITAAIATLYGLLYVLLQLEDLALLAGSVAIFLALSAAMYFTRNIDWYSTQDSRM